MDYRRKPQSYHRQRTGILITNKQHTRKKSPKKTYSKAIHPLNLHTRAMSQKNLDHMSSESSESSRATLIEDNKSCCCFDCSKPNKKMKNLQKKFGLFRTQMSVVRSQRLHLRFQNAVYCILYLIYKRRKQKLLDKQKKMFRYKTKVFLDGSPLLTPQQQQHQLNCHDEKHQMNMHSQSIQAKIIDQRHKQRQSVRIYLQQKLHDKDSQITLPKIQKINQSSYTNIQPLRFSKGDEQKSPRCSTYLKISHQTENSPCAIQHSPYLNHLTSRNPIDTIIQSSFSKTPRTITKNFSSELLTQKHQFHQRKNTAATLKGLV
ncbi:unnamed protein product [Paramecium pentaurelia]|uniref:Uncharacterized protein n=1 Tax=Paramecium pentaurelia TaxID=43138 RepID=A0A8S1YFP9_9CILI|nr:unnamed protein product [Paramecium pentaurelia]